MKLDEEQMEIIEKANLITGCYSSVTEETHWLNDEEAYYLIENLVEMIDNPLNNQINELHNKLDAQDKIINTQALEIARLKEENQILYKRLYEARKMIFDNYGVLDKYQIEILEDILKGEEILGDKENE